MQEKTKKKIYYAILILILLVGIITRIIKFGEIPIGINVDEAGIMYDSYCIANYGTDRFDNNFPVYMINYGGGQSVLYTYIAAIFIKIFGFSLTVIRMPALIFSILYMVFAFLIVKDLKNKKLAILIEFLIVIVPWHFMQSRWALDCNLMSTMTLISIYVLLKSKRKIMFFLSGVFFGVTLYTYALSYIILPIILILLLGYMLYIKKIKITDVLVLFIPLILFAIPLILNLFVNFGWINEIKTPFISILKMWQFRNEEIAFNNIFQNILNMFKVMFAFDINDYNAFPTFGTLYYISIPFCILGFIFSIKESIKNIKEKKLSLDIVILINFIAVFVCGILIEPSVNRINAIYFSLIYYVAVGIMSLSENKKYIFYMIITLYIIIYSLFLYKYFGIYGKENVNLSFNNDIVGIVKYIEGNDKFDNKYINLGLIAPHQYIYTLIANETPPEEFMKTVEIKDNKVYSYGRYIFYELELKENIVYVVEENDWLKDVLLKQGFTKENYDNNIDIFYKNVNE